MIQDPAFYAWLAEWEEEVKANAARREVAAPAPDRRPSDADSQRRRAKVDCLELDALLNALLDAGEIHSGEAAVRRINLATALYLEETTGCAECATELRRLAFGDGHPSVVLPRFLGQTRCTPPRAP